MTSTASKDDVVNSAKADGEEVKTVKCVIWDLDHTLWDGVLLEDREVTLREGVVDVLRTLDERGILHSIASRNDHAIAMGKLREFGIDEYFLYPQIHWGSKSTSIQTVAQRLNFGIDALAFVDDQPFERDEVRFAHPQVRCIDAADLSNIPDMREMNPRFVTDDSRIRRQMYLSDILRKAEEESHQGTSDEFLASLGMRFVIAPAGEEDLKRAEELTIRTNQLNATGYTYSYDELSRFRKSPNHELLIASLDDKYGTYGKIGLALVERSPQAWTLKLLLMSCRVMSRGVGAVLLNHIVKMAQDAGVRLLAEFVDTGRNRTMYVTYRFAGFHEVEHAGNRTILENDFSNIQSIPAHIQVHLVGDASVQDRTPQQPMNTVQ